MNITQIQDLIKFVAKSGVSEVEIEQKDFKITIKTPAGKREVQVMTTAAPAYAPAPVPMPAAAPAAAPVAAQAPHDASPGSAWCRSAGCPGRMDERTARWSCARVAGVPREGL